MVPLWDPTDVRALLWSLAAAFALGWLLFTRVFGVWPFTARAPAGREDRRSRWLGRVGALACGALPLLAFPEPALWWFAWVSLVPLLLLVRAAPTSREAALRGWWAGAGYVTATDYWLWPAVGPALVLIAFLVGLLWLPWGWAVRRMLAGRPPLTRLLGATLVRPSVWVAIEAVRSWQSLGGPWACWAPRSGTSRSACSPRRARRRLADRLPHRRGQRRARSRGGRCSPQGPGRARARGSGRPGRRTGLGSGATDTGVRGSRAGRRGPARDPRRERGDQARPGDRAQ